MTLIEFEREVIGHVMRDEDQDLLALCRQFVVEHYDPTPYCSVCGAKTSGDCSCG